MYETYTWPRKKNNGCVKMENFNKKQSNMVLVRYNLNLNIFLKLDTPFSITFNKTLDNLILNEKSFMIMESKVSSRFVSA